MNVLEQIQHHVLYLPQEARMEVLNFILCLEQSHSSCQQSFPELIEKNGTLVVRIRPLNELNNNTIQQLREERIDNLIQGTGL